MEHCQGVKDWMKCLRCMYLTSVYCPLEGTDVVAELSKALRLSDAQEVPQMGMEGGFGIRRAYE